MKLKEGFQWQEGKVAEQVYEDMVHIAEDKVVDKVQHHGEHQPENPADRAALLHPVPGLL
jgi:hypothetical protein